MRLMQLRLLHHQAAFAGTFIGSATFGPLLFDNIVTTDAFLELVEEANKDLRLRSRYA